MLTLQPKLLRVLEQRQVRLLGSNRAVEIDIRVVAATHRDLAQDVIRGRFREDLYHRLCGINLHLPALRERRYDIVLLAEQMMTHKPVLVQDSPLKLTAEFVEGLLLHPWPGNVRELRRVIHEAQLTASMEGSYRLEGGHFTPENLASPAPDPLLGFTPRSGAEPEEATRIRGALQRAGGNLIQAAVEL